MPRQSNPRSLSDIIAEVVGTIATDVRQHVVEEPWFGRAVTPLPERAHNISPEQHDTNSIDI